MSGKGQTNYYRLAIQLVLGSCLLALTTWILPARLADELNLVALCLAWTGMALAALSSGDSRQRVASGAAILFLTKTLFSLPGHAYEFPLTAPSTLGKLSFPLLLFGLACAGLATDQPKAGRGRRLNMLSLFPIGFGLLSAFLSVVWFGWGLSQPVPNSGAPVGLALFFIWAAALGSVCLLVIPIWALFFGKELHSQSLNLPSAPFRPVGLGLLVSCLVLAHLAILPTQMRKAEWLAGIEKGKQCKVLNVNWQTISGPSELDLGVMEVTPESGYGGIQPELERQLQAHAQQSKAGQQILFCKYTGGLLIRRRHGPETDQSGQNAFSDGRILG